MQRFCMSALGLAVLVCAPPASAQLTNLEVGAKAGLTFSTLSVDEAEGADFSTRSAFGVGAFLRIPLGQVALQPEVLYVRKGAEVRDEDFDPGRVIVKFDYLEVPLLLVLPIYASGGVSPYLFGGPSVAFEVGCSAEIDTPIGDFEFDCDEGEEFDFEVQRKKTDIGVVIGGGLRIPAGPGAFLIEGRYTFGLSNLNDSEEEITVQNRSGAVMLGFSLAIGR